MPHLPAKLLHFNLLVADVFASNGVSLLLEVCDLIRYDPALVKRSGTENLYT
jgi:hypothetical protein